jgi:hypothetical protein
MFLSDESSSHTPRFNIRKGDVLVMLSLLLLEYRRHVASKR